jgi:hypothetical protein
MNVKDYIKQHDHYNYCEAIIFPNGDIEDARPSHVYKLMAVTNLPKDIVNRIMPEYVSPLHWLLGYTKCISVWFDFFIYDSITEEQRNTLQELVNHEILKNNIIGNRTDEYSRCVLLDKFKKGEIEYDELPEKPTDKLYIRRK